MLCRVGANLVFAPTKQTSEGLFLTPLFAEARGT